MGDEEQRPTLREQHLKFSATAKVIIAMISVTFLLEFADIVSTWVFRRAALLDHQMIRDSVASVSAEGRLTAQRLDAFVAMSKKRWTFLREDNEGKIKVSALTAEELDLENARAAKHPSPTPTPSRHRRRHRAIPAPTPRKKYWWE